MSKGNLHPYVTQQISQFESDLQMAVTKIGRARELRDLADAVRWAPTASAIIRWHPTVRGASHKIQRAAEDRGERILKETLGKLALLESDGARLERLGAINHSRLLFSGNVPRLVNLIERETALARHQITSSQGATKGYGARDENAEVKPPAARTDTRKTPKP